ncbi:MAG: Asp-tRNA(Asn)/Glu-tRNA(Gln) amidotransferase subunit GatB [Candidatus Desulforudis sp.]|nr:Asp-tRNA(Asn)/Glu-tRNA(Gln) amidotransferase subunit GatB [Desulforudis sp.]
MRAYESVIGLEVHVELKTNSKIFCHSSTAFGGKQNTHVCPVCLGLPGSLPVLNRQVVEYGIRVALALNCSVARFCKFDRKHYFYPDLPKNYQISQYDLPLSYDGYLDFETDDGCTHQCGIVRVHMEEDAGKLIHREEVGESPAYALVDYNRTGVPLLEIVSEPDIRSAEEARAYLTELKTVVQYTGVSDCKMEEGSLRCDANVSVRPRGSKELGVKTEIKNLNSFRAVHRALDYEIERQIALCKEGRRIVQETRSWDEAKGVTAPMRGKEEAHDYRYFPDPDLVPLVISPSWIESVRRDLPEPPDARRRRYQEQYGLSVYNARVLTGSRETAEYFEECVRLYSRPKTVANWVMGDLTRLLNAEQVEIQDCRVRPAQLAALMRLIDDGTISGKIAKVILEEMFASGKDPETVIREKDLVQITDAGAISGLIEEVLAGHPGPVADYRQGKGKALGFLVGQVMKATKGKANPAMVNDLLKQKLDEGK